MRWSWETNQKQIKTEVETLHEQLYSVLRKDGYILGLFLVTILKCIQKTVLSMEQQLEEQWHSSIF